MRRRRPHNHIWVALRAAPCHLPTAMVVLLLWAMILLTTSTMEAATPGKKRVMVWTTDVAANTK
jgi:hypothetical protein